MLKPQQGKFEERLTIEFSGGNNPGIPTDYLYSAVATIC